MSFVLSTALVLLAGSVIPSSAQDGETKISQSCDCSPYNGTVYQFSEKSIDDDRMIRLSSYIGKVLSFDFLKRLG